MTALAPARPREVFCVTEHLRRDRAVADDAVAGRFTENGLTLALGPEPDWLGAGFPADEEWRIAWSKSYWGLDLAAAYTDTGDASYPRAWERLVRSFAEQVPAGLDPSDAVGRRLLNWVYAWNAFARAPGFDGLAGGLEGVLLESIAEQAAWLRANVTKARNHRTLELYALFVVGLALPDLDPEGALLAFAVAELERNLATDFRADGVHVEASTHYHLIAARSFVGLRENARRFGIALSEAFDARLHRVMDFALHCHRPDGGIPALSDADGGSYRELLALAGDLLDRPDLRWAASGGAAGTPPAERDVRSPTAATSCSAAAGARATALRGRALRASSTAGRSARAATATTTCCRSSSRRAAAPSSSIRAASPTTRANPTSATGSRARRRTTPSGRRPGPDRVPPAQAPGSRRRRPVPRPAARRGTRRPVGRGDHAALRRRPHPPAAVRRGRVLDRRGPPAGGDAAPLRPALALAPSAAGALTLVDDPDFRPRARPRPGPGLRAGRVGSPSSRGGTPRATGSARRRRSSARVGRRRPRCGPTHADRPGPGAGGSALRVERDDRGRRERDRGGDRPGARATPWAGAPTGAPRRGSGGRHDAAARPRPAVPHRDVLLDPVALASASVGARRHARVKSASPGSGSCACGSTSGDRCRPRLARPLAGGDHDRCPRRSFERGRAASRLCAGAGRPRRPPPRRSPRSPCSPISRPSSGPSRTTGASAALDARTRRPAAALDRPRRRGVHARSCVAYVPEKAATARCVDAAGRPVAYVKAYDGRHAALQSSAGLVHARARRCGGHSAPPGSSASTRRGGPWPPKRSPAGRWPRSAPPRRPLDLARLGAALAGLHAASPPPGLRRSIVWPRTALGEAARAHRPRPARHGRRPAGWPARSSPRRGPASRSASTATSTARTRSSGRTASGWWTSIDVRLGPAAADLGSLLAGLRYQRSSDALAGRPRAPSPARCSTANRSVRRAPRPGRAAWHTAASLLAERALRAVTRVRPAGLEHLGAVMEAAAGACPKRRRTRSSRGPGAGPRRPEPRAPPPLPARRRASATSRARSRWPGRWPNASASSS